MQTFFVNGYYIVLRYDSVTILGDLFHFGQLFNACGNNYFAQIVLILGNFPVANLIKAQLS